MTQVAFFAVLGLSMGSFLTVVAERLDTAESFWSGRSHCNHCKKTLSWWELLPVIGYVMVQGKCVHCSKKIPLLYPVFEAITGLAFVALWIVYAPVSYWLLAFQLVIASLLILLFIYDWINQSFPAWVLYITAGFVACGVIIQSLMGISVHSIAVQDSFLGWLSSPPTFWRYIVGALVGSGLLGLLAFPSRGTWMGYGDVILGFILGLWLGYPLILVSLVLAFYGGAAVGIWQIASRSLAKDHRIAFGPFLIAGAFVTHVWGASFFHAIMRLWGVSL